MIVDTSALVAIINEEPESLTFLRLLHTNRVTISAATLFEFGMLIDRYKKPAATVAADRLISQIEPEIAPVDEQLARLARAAYVRFGKGNHPARLNFGDCFTYALARQTGEPLLFKGDDFGQTDIVSAA